MRTSSWLAALLISGLAGSAQAQCCYIAPPRAPDMLNQPGWYQYNCQGYVYGPYYNVRPPFEPFQGMLPAPQCFAGAGGGGGMQGFNPAQPSPYGGMMMQQAMQQAMMGGQGGQGMGHPGGVPGLWMHPAVRSPRDFFMIETDPARRFNENLGVVGGFGAGYGGPTGSGAAPTPAGR